MAVSKRFGQYRKEEKKEVRAADVNESETLRQLKTAWAAYEHIRSSGGYSEQSYERASGLILSKSLNYTSEDIEEFSLLLAGFQHEENFSEKVGVFLSALINNGKDESYTVHTRHLASPIDCLGCRNRKNVTVNGDVGAYTFQGMECGSVVIEGDALTTAAQWLSGGEVVIKGNTTRLGIAMKGGRIITEGHAGGIMGWMMEDGEIIAKGDVYSAGFEMRGGKIRIEGNAGVQVGSYMKGGEIHLEGSYESIAEDIQGGKIFHKGKLIVDK